MKRHMAEAFHWSGERIDVPAMLAAALGMAGPILTGATFGDLAPGLAAALGALLASGARTDQNAREQARSLTHMLAVVAIAATVAVLIAGRGGWTDAAIAGSAGCAAIVGGYSYPLAVATGRFIPFLVISLSLAENGGHRIALLVLLMLGALWTSFTAFTLGIAFRTAGWHEGPAPDQRRAATVAQKLRRWTASLETLAGWQFALRLVPSLAVAGVVRTLWPDHHFLWIALTIALLCQRQLELLPAKTVQRALGAAIGVAATGVLLERNLPAWGLALSVAVLAGLGPWLRMQNYLAYTASMTPLVILLLSAGGPIETGTLADRLVATLIAAALVVAANMSTAALLRVRAIGPS